MGVFVLSFRLSSVAHQTAVVSQVQLKGCVISSADLDGDAEFFSHRARAVAISPLLLRRRFLYRKRHPLRRYVLHRSAANITGVSGVVRGIASCSCSIGRHRNQIHGIIHSGSSRLLARCRLWYSHPLRKR